MDCRSNRREGSLAPTVRPMATKPPRSASSLPSSAELAEAVTTGRFGKSAVADSVAYLVSHAPSLARWEDAEDLGVAAYALDAPDSSARAVAHHLEVVRGELARQLWSRQVFVGVTVLDELLFEAARDGSADPVLTVAKQLKSRKRDMSSLLVLPLHSFGISAGGLLRPFGKQDPLVMDAARRFAISTQTNKLDRTIDLLRSAAPQLGVTKPLDAELIEHWRRSRDARWLERNPLLIAGITSVTGWYYENEFLLLGRVRSITSAVVMLTALQPRSEDRVADFFSSSKINNWQTRDLRHYLLLYSQGTGPLTGRAVPVHGRRAVDELSDLAVDLDPRYWNRYSAKADLVHSMMDRLYGGYLQHSVGNRRETRLGRLYRKLFDAVHYFRRSFHDDWTATISLATAFEMMLTDNYSRGVTERLRRRTELLLKGQPGTKRYQQAVVDVYDARSATVHGGALAMSDLDVARRAFVLVFLNLMTRLPNLPVNEPEPLAYLTEDRP